VSGLLELRSGAARLVLAPKIGGAIAAYEWNGQPVLRPTSAEALAAEDVRGFASYPLVPFSNRIAGAQLRWNGRAYPLERFLPGETHAIHGNGWRRAWSIVEAGPAHATLELVHAATEPAHEWPFAYRARQRFELEPTALALKLSIVNESDKAFPFGLGWHPFFPRNAHTVLGFAAAGVWRTDATRLPLELERIAPAFDFSAARPIAATAMDNCFAGWRPPATIAWPDRALAVTISADESCAYLVVFIPPNGDYLAVEPVTHMTDAFNRADAGQRDTGTRLLAPGGRFSCTMRLSVTPV
jgi:aldose 1-epimerase